MVISEPLGGVMVKDLGNRGSLQIDGRSLSIIVFATFSAWLLAFPFQGQVLYSLASRYAFDPKVLVFGAIAAHFAGLLGASFLVKTMRAAKQVMLYTIVFGVASSSCFFFAPSALWYLLWPASMLAGVCVAAWGFYFASYTEPGDRLQTAARVLIYSNVLMIAVNMMAVYLLPEVGLVTAIVLLIFAFGFAIYLPEQIPIAGVSPVLQVKPPPIGFDWTLRLLCLFIVVLSINSGLMYQVINPAFAHHKWLVNWYWALPYVVALRVMQKYAKRGNRAITLYVAMAMIGFAFIFFMVLDRSAPSYLLINTLMMGACGVFDLFWWSILGEMLDLDQNPAKVLGVGLAANVLGVLLGGLLGNKIMMAPAGQLFEPVVIAFGVLMVTLVILPLLLQRLSRGLTDQAFAAPAPVALSSSAPVPVPAGPSTSASAPALAGPSASASAPAMVAAQPPLAEQLAKEIDLTEREAQIADLLQRGRTYKMIADELFLSENTVKTHVKKVYSKLGVRSKAELIRLLGQDDSRRPH